MCKDTCLLSYFRPSLLVKICTITKLYLFRCTAQEIKPCHQGLFVTVKASRDKAFKRSKYRGNVEFYNQEWEALTFDPIFDNYL